MINSVQRDQGTLNHRGQEVGFGVVKFKNYSPELLEQAIQSDFNEIFPNSAEENLDRAKSMAKRLHGELEPVISKFQQSSDTLTLSIIKPAGERLNWISARLKMNKKEPIIDMDRILDAEFKFLEKVKSY